MKPMPELASIRAEYRQAELDEQTAGTDPHELLQKWLQEALHAQVNEPTAMTLATVDAKGAPDARVVLLKSFDEKGLVFFTNYESSKGQHLAQEPHACMLFFWAELERQVRIKGTIQKVDASESDAYFGERPRESCIGAWTSPQSQNIPSREWLIERFMRLQSDFSEKIVERPPFWGGYRLSPSYVEFWQGRPSRLHDRFAFTCAEPGRWIRSRLAP